MKIVRPVLDSRNPPRSRFAVNRRLTVMLAIGSVIDLASGARPARSAARTTKSPLQDLKMLGTEGQVVAIRHNRNRFEVQTADGRTTAIAAVNLRFKIDTSDNGPSAGRPVILPSGMMGDRATVFFASPLEIGTLIQHQS